MKARAGDAVVPSDLVGMRVSSRWKDARHESVSAGDIAAQSAGPESPVPKHQAIEFAGEFGTKKISRSNRRNVAMKARAGDAAAASDLVWMRVSSQPKNAPREQAVPGSKTGVITGGITGLESPVMRNQAIEVAQHFFGIKFSRLFCDAARNLRGRCDDRRGKSLAKGRDETRGRRRARRRPRLCAVSCYLLLRFRESHGLPGESAR